MGEAHKTVVVLDDSPLVLEAVQASLVPLGFRVYTAENIAELDRILSMSTVDLFVLDVQMPEAFGDDIARVLRAVRKYEARILLYSSVEPADLAARAEAAEVDGFVSKDDGVLALVERIVELIGSPAADATTLAPPKD